jgi:arabinofuranosyltransferase
LRWTVAFSRIGTRRCELALVVLAGLLFVAHSALYWDWVEDDAYISLRYASNLVGGEGLVFNPGQRIEGYSNLVWVLLEAGSLHAGANALVVARVVGILGGVGCLWLSWLLVRRLWPGAGLAAALAPWFLALDPVLPRHAVTGLETDGYAFLLTAGVMLAMNPSRAARAWPIPAVVTLLSLWRPEGAAFGLILAVMAHRSRALPRRVWLAPLALLVVVAAWRWWYFGSLLPNTFHFKMTGGAAALLPGLHYALDFLRENGGAALVGFGLVLLLEVRAGRIVRGMLAVVGLQVAIVIAAGGDWMPHYRFLAPVMPLLAALFAAGVSQVVAWARLVRRPRVAVMIVVACLLAMGMNIYKTERQVWRLVMPSVKSDGYLTQAYTRVGHWLRANTPADAVIAASDVGAVGYYSQRWILDMLGLVDPHIARTRGELHAKRDPEYVLARQPDFVILIEGRDATCEPIYWRQSDRALAAKADFTANYRQVHAVAIDFLNESAQIFARQPIGAPRPDLP